MDRQRRNTMAKKANGTTEIVEKTKPVFVKVDEPKPGTTRFLNLIVKVVDSNPIKPVIRKNGRSIGFKAQPVRPSRIAEALIGDETGCILFTARNEQVDLMKPGTTVILRNAKIDMFKETTMRMAVDKWGLIEVTEPASFQVKQDNNLSLIEYELVDVPHQQSLT